MRGKVIFITGGTSGMGLTTAIQFLQQGVRVVYIIGRSRQKADQAFVTAQSEIGDKNIASRLKYIAADVRVEAQIAAAIKIAFDAEGAVDVFVNAAGVQPGNSNTGGDIVNMELQSFVGKDGSIIWRLPPPQPMSSLPYPPIIPSQYTPASKFAENPIATSAIGVFYSLKNEIKMVYEKQPTDRPVSIVNIASRNGFLPDMHRPLYAASKAFIISLTSSLATQCAHKSIHENKALIRINSVAPGPVDTPLERGAYVGATDAASLTKLAAKYVPLERLGKKSEVASAILYLCSEGAGYITGETIKIDGGFVPSPDFSFTG